MMVRLFSFLSIFSRILFTACITIFAIKIFKVTTTAAFIFHLYQMSELKIWLLINETTLQCSWFEISATFTESVPILVLQDRLCKLTKTWRTNRQARKAIFYSAMITTEVFLLSNFALVFLLLNLLPRSLLDLAW